MNAKMSTSRTVLAAAAMALALLAGCKEKENPPPAPALVNAPVQPVKPALVSAEKNSFNEVTAKLDKGGNLYVYLSTEKAMSGLSNGLIQASNLLSGMQNIPGAGRETLDKVFAVLGRILQDSGISRISGLGMSSIARESGFYYSKMIVHHYPGQNEGLAWSLFGKTPHSLKALDFLPENTALASVSDLDLPLLWTNILQAVRTVDNPEANSALDQLPAKFHELTGLDLDAVLNSLSGEYGVILTLDPHKMVTLPLPDNPLEIPNPALCLMFKVKSDLIFDRVDQILNGSPIVKPLLNKADEPDLKMLTVTLPIPLPVEVRPSLARVGDYLLLASSDTLVRQILAVKSGKTNGYKSTAEFKRLSQDVPNDGNNFSLTTSAIGALAGQIQEKAMASQKMDPEALKTFQQLFQRGANAGAYSVGVNGPDGWEGFSNGSQNPSALLLVPIAFVVGGVAAIAVPNFVQARTTAQKNGCINNLRKIESAKQQWALENKKQSTDTPAMSDLQTYLAPGPDGKMPVCAQGGVYTVGSVGEKPTCSIPGHELP
jgi:hypothetical protein